MISGLRVSAFSLVVAGASVAIGFSPLVQVHAQTTAQIERCVNEANVYSPDLQIEGCTAAIQSRRLRGKDLARSLYNRGTAYYKKRDYDRAVADYTEAIRLDPNTGIDYHANRAIAYEYKGDYDQGQPACDPAFRQRNRSAAMK
jgi:tetratricopeptide (TPR) repeat protein